MGKYLFFILIIFSIHLSFCSVSFARDVPHIILNGRNVEFSISPVLRDNIIYIPVQDKGTTTIVSYFGAIINYKADEIYIAEFGKPSRFKAGRKESTISGESVKINNPPFIQNNIIYLSLDDLSRVLFMHYGFNKDGNIVLVPKIYKITCEKNPAGYIEVLVYATAKIEYNVDYLNECYGFVVNIPDSFIDIPENIHTQEEGIIKNISAVQADGQGRIEIRLTKPLQIGIAHRINLSIVPIRIEYSGNPVTELWLPKISEEFLSQNSIFNRPQLINSIDFKKLPDRRIIKISSTGFLRYEWHRMSKDDKRFYIDFTKAVIKKINLTRPIEDDIISDIKLVQLSNNPPLVRLIFTVKKKVDVNISSQEKSNDLFISIPDDEKERDDFFTTGKGYFGNQANNKTIVIDPGHGGQDTGAINSSIGLMEKDLNLDIASRLEELLIKAGFNVILTRRSDRDLTWDGSPDKMELEARASIANDLEADVFICIHNDSSDNSDLSGTCTYYYKDIDYQLACTVQKYLVENLNITNRGMKKANFYVLKHTKMPSVLIEVAFMSNKKNGLLLTSPEFREKAAEGICESLIEYFGNSNIKVQE